jgi:hypothetical protein
MEELERKENREIADPSGSVVKYRTKVGVASSNSIHMFAYSSRA